jgi:hypothetical protein
MRRHGIGIVLTAAVSALVVGAGPALADVPVGPARYVTCPGFTDEPARYRAPERTAYRCHSAVVDPLGNVVILRQGRAGAFGWLHALLDHNVDDHVIERVIGSSYPRTAPRNRFRYSAELRVDGHGVMAVWVEIDRNPSTDAPDSEPFGVLTAYCKIPHNADPEEKCPEWVNDSLLA